MNATRASVAARPNSVRIGTMRNEMSSTSIASNIQPRPLVMRSFQWNRFSGTASSRATKDSAAKASLGEEQLRVQDRRAGGAADRVVTEHDELEAEDRVLAHAPDDRGHPPLRVAVEHGLRAVRLVADDDRTLRSARELELLRPAAELAQRALHVVHGWRPSQADADRLGVAVADAHAVAVDR